MSLRILGSDPDAIGPDGRRLADVGKSSYELRKEQEAREQEAERLAAFKLHLSILASLGCLLFAVTVTCIGLTLRRRHREAMRQVRKIQVLPASPSDTPINPRENSKMNHMMSDGALLEDKSQLTHSSRLISLSRNNSIQGPKDASALQKVNKSPLKNLVHNQGGAAVISGWNSTDSMDAPLLWQKLAPPETMMDAQNQFGLTNNTRYYRSVTYDKNNMPSQTGRARFLPSRSKCSQVRPVDEPITTGQTTFEMQTKIREPAKATESSPQQRTIRKLPPSGYESTPNLHGSPQRFRIPNVDKSGGMPCIAPNHNNDAVWVAGSSEQRDDNGKLLQVNETPAASRQPHRATRHTEWSATAFKPIDAELQHNHIPNCRMINRTQSWGGCLKTAGIDTVESWGQHPLTHACQRHFPPSARIVGNLPHNNSQEEETSRYMPGYNPESGRMLTKYGHGHPGGVPSTTLLAASRSKSYTNMPGVNATFVRGLEVGSVAEQWEVGVASQQPASNRDLKPPSAKRPRIVNAVQNSQWVPTRFLTVDSEDGFSMTSAVMDTFCSTQNDNKVFYMEEPQPIGESAWRRQPPDPLLLPSDGGLGRDRVGLKQSPTGQAFNEQEGTSSSQSQANSMVDNGHKNDSISESSHSHEAFSTVIPYRETSHLVFQDNHLLHDHNQITLREASANWPGLPAPGEASFRGVGTQNLRVPVPATMTAPNIVVYNNQYRLVAASSVATENPALDESPQIRDLLSMERARKGFVTGFWVGHRARSGFTPNSRRHMARRFREARNNERRNWVSGRFVTPVTQSGSRGEYKGDL